MAAGPTDPDFTTATNFFSVAQRHGRYQRHGSDGRASHRRRRCVDAAPTPSCSGGQRAATTVLTCTTVLDDRLAEVLRLASQGQRRARHRLQARHDDDDRATQPAPWTFSNMPEFAANVIDADCVLQKLQGSRRQVPDATVADICGCLPTDIAARRGRVHQAQPHGQHRLRCRDAMTPAAAGYRRPRILYAMGTTQHT